MRWILFLLLLLAFTILRAADSTLQQVTYRLSIPENSATGSFYIQVQAAANHPQQVHPLQDFYGTPALDKMVHGLRPLQGCSIDTAGGKKMIRPNSQGEVHFEYRILYDTAYLENFSFAPAAGSDYFHLAGCQWMLPLGNQQEERQYQFSFPGKPAGWYYYASQSRHLDDFVYTGSYEDAAQVVIGGSQKMPHRFSALGKPVDLYLANQLPINDSLVYGQVEQLFGIMRGWFADSTEPFYIVPVVKRKGIVAGNALPHMFRCFVRADVREMELLLLLAHELFHTWLPGQIRVSLPAGAPGFANEWFTEGFTEYVSWLLLQQAGILTPQQFADLINTAIRNLEDNPFKNHDLQQLAITAKAGKGGTALKKLSYYRGALMAMAWDEKIKAGTHNRQSISDFILSLYRHARDNEYRPMDSEIFYTIAAQYYPAARKDVDSYIGRGENIALPGRWNKYRKVQVAVPSFDPGFDVAQTFARRRVAGVVTGSEAYKAGLRDGQQLVSIANSNRFINGWRPDEPLRVTISDEGNNRVIAFYPRGNNRPVWQYK